MLSSKRSKLTKNQFVLQNKLLMNSTLSFASVHQKIHQFEINHTEYLISLSEPTGNSALTTEEFESSFKCLKPNKAASVQKIKFNTFLDIYDKIKYILFLVLRNCFIKFFVLTF